MKKIIHFSRFFLFLMVMLLASCSKTPMQKLESSTVYSDMSQTFWVKQYDQKTQLWSEAVEYCMNNSDKPNCDAVSRVWMLGDSAK
ncbi:MAG: hypothetical protein SFW07_06470 [Gammaproteobacteria bacterium]|nr:hypothetical protein [Gammaproteobacteria bacterium]